MKIGIFDSGIGGTTVMSAIKKLLPQEEYRYIADSEHCPYGEKSDRELYRIVCANVEELIEWGAKIIVIACNTATTRCISKLREDYPDISFIGTEPAIAPAARSGVRNILVLATPGTINSARLKYLISRYQRPGQQFELFACPGLAETIEKNYHSHPEQISAKLTELFSDLDFSPDIIVLGCTHYPLVRRQILSFFPGAQAIDGASGIAHSVKRLVAEASSTK